MDDVERKTRADAARVQHRKLGRLIDLWEQGLSDAAVAAQLGWRDGETVYRFRQLLRLQLGNPGGRRKGLGKGRWRDAHALMHGEAP